MKIENMKLQETGTRVFYSDTLNAQVKATTFQLGDYSVIHRLTVFPSGNRFVDVTVQKNHDRRFLPEIYSRQDLNGDLTGFEIQTTAYGTLPIEGIDEVIEGFQEAQQAVRLLEGLLKEIE